MFADAKFVWLVATGILVGIFEFLALSEIRLPSPLDSSLFLIIILGIGYKTLWHGLRALIKLQFKSINALMFIAVVGALYLGKYEEAAVVIVLYTLAEKLEDIGIETSQSALNALVEKMPKLVTLKQEARQIPIDEVKVGDIIIIKPSEMIALDGKVVAGSSYVDESTITGEPIPKDKGIDDFVYAGTLNKNGVLEIAVTKRAVDSTFSKIKELTFQATKSKASTQKFIETFAQYYTPSVMFIAFALAVVPTVFFGQPFDPWLLKALTLIVIACPCAMVISTPVSIYSAIGNASKHGAIIKGGRYMEAIGQIRAIALDKTRTLTYGRPVLSDVISFGSSSRDEVLACAGGIEIFSEHPLAQSIVDAAKKGALPLHDVQNFRSIVGKGAKADCLICTDTHHSIGKLSFILEDHHVPQYIVDRVLEKQNEGKIVILIATHQEVKGLIALTDEIRPQSKALVAGLKKLDIKSVMLSGDHAISANFVAQQLEIDDVRADLLPEDKASCIQELVHQYKAVAMVGDGVNDAPALALSSVGITIGSLGSDMAIEASSIVILNDRLDIIPFLVRLGKKTIRTIQVNTGLAIAIKVIFILLALFGMSNLALAILADVGITLIVILISLRLLKWHEA